MLSDSAIAKKRQFAQERAERLKDPKQRVMGIDKAALDEQVRERQAMKRQEVERDAYYDRQALLMDKHALALQAEVNDIRTRREKDLVEYRAVFQKKEAARDFDLVDPKGLRADLPARVSDDDPRNGPSSLQRFEGEDLEMKKRRAAQQRQQREWAQQQIDEKLAKKWMEQEAGRQYDSRAEETNFRTYQIEQSVAEQRRQRDASQAEFNRALAEQKRRESLRDREMRTQQNMEEIHNMLTSDFLTEHEGIVSNLGEKIKAERFRGLAPEAQREIRDEQNRQRQEMHHRRLQDAEDERQWAQQEAVQTRMANALDRQRERERRQEAAKLAQDLKAQAQEAAERKKHLEQLYRNQIGENYYKHWGNCL